MTLLFAGVASSSTLYLSVFVFSFFMGMGGVGFSPSHAVVVWGFGFLVWVVLRLLLGWGGVGCWP
jgi:hypothetical protein